MARDFQAVKGMRDLLPPETALWAAIEALARRIFTTYGFEEIRTPIVEETELFVRSVGESTDIVGFKEGALAVVEKKKRKAAATVSP